MAVQLEGPRAGEVLIEEEALQANARDIGRHLKDGLAALVAGRDDIADVRGAGLFIAVECVLNAEDRAPNARLVASLVNHLRRNGVLISATGPGANILKIRPPLVMTRLDADYFLSALEAALKASGDGR
jgi:4-aminobutyrate aminotransferase-like enzyme